MESPRNRALARKSDKPSITAKLGINKFVEKGSKINLMKEKITINLRGTETCERLIRKGWRSIVNIEILEEYDLESTSVFDQEIILYLTKEQENGINQPTKQPHAASRVYPAEIPSNSEQRHRATGPAMHTILPPDRITDMELARLRQRDEKPTDAGSHR